MISKIMPRGDVVIEHIRDGKVLSSQRCHNDVTNEGLNMILDVMFASGTQTLKTSWFMGLIVGASAPTLSAADTMSSHAGWTEIDGGDISQSTRPTWLSSDAVSSQSLTNATAVTFDILDTVTVRGMFLTNISTKGSTSGKLWATALFGAAISAVNGDQIKVTYTISAGL